MAKADRVYITPPTNTPVDTTRRRFLTVAAGASFVSAASLAAPAALPDPAFALIADKRAMDIAQGEAIDAQDEAPFR